MDLDALEGIKRKLNLSTMGKPALIGIAAVLLLVAVVVAGRLVGAATTTSIEIAKGASQQEQKTQYDSESSSLQVQGESNEPKRLFVHVTGAVVSPGLYELDSGARVADVVAHAGGFTEEAAQESVNLARLLADGEQIYIATRQQVDEGGVGAASVPGMSNGSSGKPNGGAAGLVNINTANEAELETLPGIGESTARKIVEDRQSNGMFSTIEDLMRVSGIGAKKFESIQALICV